MLVDIQLPEESPVLRILVDQQDRKFYQIRLIKEIPIFVFEQLLNSAKVQRFGGQPPN